MAAGRWLQWYWLRRVLLHWIYHLGTFKLRCLSLLIPHIIDMLPTIAMRLRMLANGRVGRQSVLIILELRILDIPFLNRISGLTSN